MNGRPILGLSGVLLGVGMVLHAQQSHVQIAQTNSPAVVTVNILQKDGSTHTGTGFVVTPDGYIVTNRHVLDKALYLNVSFANAVTSGEAIPVAQHNEVDLAILKIQAQQVPYVTLGDSDTVQPGQTITVIGNPRRLQNTVSAGLISQIRLQKNGTTWQQISAPISPSSSGSPVFNEKGTVIGVVFASLAGEGNQNLNFAVPINYAKPLLAQAGATLPQSTPSTNTRGFVRHVQKSWEICKRLWNRWFGNTHNTLANSVPNS